MGTQLMGVVVVSANTKSFQHIPYNYDHHMHSVILLLYIRNHNIICMYVHECMYLYDTRVNLLYIVYIVHNLPFFVCKSEILCAHTCKSIRNRQYYSNIISTTKNQFIITKTNTTCVQ